MAEYETMEREPLRIRYKGYLITIAFPNDEDFVILVVQRPSNTLRAIAMCGNKTGAIARAKEVINKELQAKANG